MKRDPSMHDPFAGGAAIRAVYDVDAAARAHLRTITADDLYSLLTTVATPFQSVILGTIGMHSPRSLSKAAAAQVLAKLRSRKISDSAFEYGVLDMPMMHALVGELSPRSWADMLSRETPEAALDCARTDIEAVVELFDDLHMANDKFTPLALLAAIVEDLPTATVALAILAITDQSARDAWMALEAKGTELPELPVRDLADLYEVLRESDLADEDSDSDVGPGTSLADEPVSAEATAALEAGDISGLLSAVGLRNAAGEGSTEDDDLLAVFDQLAEVTNEVAAAVNAGDMPFEELSTMADRVAVLMVANLPRVGARANLEARVEAAAASRLEAQRAAADRVWLAQMVGVTGPEGVAKDLADVSAVASAHLSGEDADRSVDDLRALHHFLDLSQRRTAGEAVAFDDMLSSEGAARAAWASDPGLLSAASYGFVTMPPAEQVPVGVEESVAVADEAVDTARVPRSDEGEPANDDDAAATAEVDDDAAATAEVDDDAAATAEVDDDVDDAPRTDEATPDKAGAAAEGNGPLATDQADDASQGPDDASQGPDDASQGPDDASQGPDDASQGPDGTDDEDLGPDSGGDDPTGDNPNGPDSAASESDPVPPTDDDSGLDDLSDLDDALDDLSALDELLDAGAAPALNPKAPSKVEQPAAAAAAPLPARTDTAAAPEVPAPERAWDRVDVVEAVAAATADLRLGLAADLALAADAPEASVRARRLAAFGQQLRNPGGHLAAAFSDEAAHLRREDLGDDRPAQLLAWAAAARIALLAPNAGPARVLTELAPCIADRKGLSTVGEALIDASRTGVVVLPETTAAIGNVAVAESALDDAVAALEDILATSNRRVLSYQPANAIYQEWISLHWCPGVLPS